MTTRYAVGTWLGLVEKEACLLVPGTTSESAVDFLWQALDHGGGFADVLQVLISEPKVSLTTLPAFAAVFIEEGAAHVAARGRVRITAATPQGDVVVDGSRVATWREDTVADPTTVTLAALDVDPGQVLPLAAGVVLAARIDLAVAEGIAAAAEGRRTSVSPAPKPEIKPPKPEIKPPEPEIKPPEPSPRHDDLSQPSPGPWAPIPPPIPLAESVRTAVPLPPPPLPPADVLPPPPPPPVGVVPQSQPRPVSSPGEVTMATSNDPSAVSVASPTTREAGSSDFTTFLPQTTSGWGPALTGQSDGGAAADQSMSPSVLPYDDMFDGPTKLSLAEEAAVRDEPSEEAATDPPPTDPAAPHSDTDEWADEADHDGWTVMKMPGTTIPPPPPPAYGVSSNLSGPLILARVCPSCSKPNSTLRVTCGGCGGQLSGDAVQVPRPILGRILLSTGERIVLDQPVIIGRKPRSPRFSNQDVPRLVSVNGPHQDISRSHLKIELEDWSVMVSDMGSTNGTTLRRPGLPERRLQGPEPVVAQVGDVYDMGDGVTMTVEELA